jgi:hypothetical protein
VNLALGHTTEGRDQLHVAIESFERGTGDVGTGLAAMCWVDVSRSFSGADELDAAQLAARRAVEVALTVGDPWVLHEAEAHLGAVSGPP